MELESFILELLQWIRVLQIWDVSFLNSLETMLTNKIIREIVLFWKKNPAYFGWEKSLPRVS